MSKLAEIEAERAERKAKLQAAADTQRETDMAALNDAEIQHGDTSTCYIDVPYTPGLPTMAVARMPKPDELKRYRQTLKVTPGEKLDIHAQNEAAATLGAVVVVYPDKDLFKAMCEARPDLKAQLGQRAVKLAQGRAADEKNE